MSSSPPPLVQDDSEVRGPHLPADQHRGKKPLTATEVDMAKKLYDQEKEVKRLNDKIKELIEWNIILERYLSIPLNQIADIEEFKEKPRKGRLETRTTSQGK